MNKLDSLQNITWNRFLSIFARSPCFQHWPPSNPHRNPQTVGSGSYAPRRRGETPRRRVEIRRRAPAPPPPTPTATRRRTTSIDGQSQLGAKGFDAVRGQHLCRSGKSTSTALLLYIVQLATRNSLWLSVCFTFVGWRAREREKERRRKEQRQTKRKEKTTNGTKRKRKRRRNRQRQRHRQSTNNDI